MSGGKPPRPRFNGVVMETVDSSCLIVTERGPVKSQVLGIEGSLLRLELQTSRLGRYVKVQTKVIETIT